jgi:hypothetical protein
VNFFTRGNPSQDLWPLLRQLLNAGGFHLNNDASPPLCGQGAMISEIAEPSTVERAFGAASAAFGCRCGRRIMHISLSPSSKNPERRFPHLLLAATGVIQQDGCLLKGRQTNMATEERPEKPGRAALKSGRSGRQNL